MLTPLAPSNMTKSSKKNRPMIKIIIETIIVKIIECTIALFASSVRSGVIAMAGGLVIVPVVSLFTKKEAPEVVNRFFECYEEKVSVAKKEALD